MEEEDVEVEVVEEEEEEKSREENEEMRIFARDQITHSWNHPFPLQLEHVALLMEEVKPQATGRSRSR
jgi:hypothetical protein